MISYHSNNFEVVINMSQVPIGLSPHARKKIEKSKISLGLFFKINFKNVLIFEYFSHLK